MAALAATVPTTVPSGLPAAVVNVWAAIVGAVLATTLTVTVAEAVWFVLVFFTWTVSVKLALSAGSIWAKLATESWPLLLIAKALLVFPPVIE